MLEHRFGKAVVIGTMPSMKDSLSSDGECAGSTQWGVVTRASAEGRVLRADCRAGGDLRLCGVRRRRVPGVHRCDVGEEPVECETLLVPPPLLTLQWSRWDALGSSLVEPSIVAHRAVKRRYYLVQQTKDAERIGIVVGTTAAAGVMDTVNRLRKLVNDSGRRAYVFHVGKINEAKLCNFPEVDSYCIVACPGECARPHSLPDAGPQSTACFRSRTSSSP